MKPDRRLARFIARSTRNEDGCLIWGGYINKHGYARAGGRQAHREVYQLVHGPVPADMDVDHICHNRACIEIAHLRVLTPSENRSMTSHSAKTACVRGHSYDEQNTYRAPGRRGGTFRTCRTCQREAVARYRARKATA